MKKSLTLRTAIAITVLYLFAWRTAGAYPINSMISATGTESNDLWLPFQNFINSINSVGTSSFTIGMPTATSSSNNGLLAVSAQIAIQQFDNWLYGIIGFHILDLFTAGLTIFSWLLGWLKSGVDWFLGLIH